MLLATTRRALAAATLLLSSSLAKAFITQASASTTRLRSRTASPSAVAVCIASRAQRRVGRQRPGSLLEMAAGGGGDKTRVLFVCLGNICRSPTAEAVFKQVTSKAGEADKFDIDSCGTGGGSSSWYKDGGSSYHEGDSPDSRMTAAAAKRGVKLSGGSRPLRPSDLEDFDIIVGMDAENSKAISTAAEHWGKAALAASKMRTMTSYCRGSGGAKFVPDPYYGGPQGFETVLDLLDDACEGLMTKCLEGAA